MDQDLDETNDITEHTWGLLRAFRAQWPQAENGPAHIVLSDGNVEDDCVLWCRGLVRAALSRNANDLLEPIEDAAFMELMEWYGQCDPDELRATEAFLDMLLTIPEHER